MKKIFSVLLLMCILCGACDRNLSLVSKRTPNGTLKEALKETPKGAPNRKPPKEILNIIPVRKSVGMRVLSGI
ncbi:MAG: hypothetical protein LBN01_01515, partial [Endomicrobium sp.]|nr:hypothetical protein [Endomicrobium sp.]